MHINYRVIFDLLDLHKDLKENSSILSVLTLTKISKKVVDY